MASSSLAEKIDWTDPTAAPRPSGLAGPAAWIALILVLLVPVWWGADASFPWDSDNIAPGSVLKGMAVGFGPGWWSTYGPLPYYLVAAVYAPILLAFKLAGQWSAPSPEYPYGFAHPEVAIVALVVGSRLMSVACALGIALLAVHWARRESRHAGWLGPLMLLGTIEFVHRGRVSNVDIYYVFFLWLGVHLAEAPRAPLRRLAAGAAAAALAVCCKEQAGPAAVVIVGWAAVRAWRLRGGAAGAWPAVLVGLAALAAYAAAWQLPMNLEGWRLHHEFLFASALGERTHAPTLSGQAGLLLEAFRWSPLALGYPMLLGVVLALALRVPLGGLGLRAACCAGYLAGFLMKIGYVFPRFLLPFGLLLLPLAVRGISAALERLPARPRARVALTSALVVVAAFGGPVLSAVQLQDRRLDAERWIRAHVPPGATVEVAGNAHTNVRVPRSHRVVRTTEKLLHQELRGPVGDVVVLTSIEQRLLHRDPQVRTRWWEPLHDPAGPYRLAARFERPPWAAFAHGIWVAPDITIFRRVGPAAAAAAP